MIITYSYFRTDSNYDYCYVHCCYFIFILVFDFISFLISIDLLIYLAKVLGIDTPFNLVPRW